MRQRRRLPRINATDRGCARSTRNRGQFPTEQAALKVLYLAVRNLDEYRGTTAGLRSSGWKQALQAFTILLRGTHPHTTTTTSTYTGHLTLPPSRRRG
jgi:hypothetical protein